MRDKQIDQILNTLRSINKDEFKASITTENSFDSILIELSFLENKIDSQKKRIKNIIECITESCTGNLNNQIPISSEEDELDVISLGFNTFLEELTETTVSKDKLIEANKEIIEREQKLDEAQKVAKIGSWEYDFTTNKTIWSKQLYSIFEISPDTTGDLIEQFRSKIHPEDVQFFEKMASFDQSAKSHFHEFRLITKKKSIKYILATIYSNFEKGKSSQILGTFQDITERKKTEQKVLELEQSETKHKKKLIEAILFTKEKEQKRMAQELHDDIGSSLMVIKFAVHKFDVEEEKKQELYDSISEIVEKVRNLSNELSPNVLEEFGLVNALRHYSVLLKKSTPLEVYYDTNIIDHTYLTKEEEISLYRVVQEIINNILKYAEATIVKIDLSYRDNLISLTIEDNGKGFIPSNKHKNGYTLGILNIESRIDYIQAEISYIPRKPKGTIVKILKIISV
ncbi:MAG: PAS domain-containing protein [Flavobacteriia bacterium]|nr:PAS domain-containing protein [Flavobacteriia bacterium]